MVRIISSPNSDLFLREIVHFGTIVDQSTFIVAGEIPPVFCRARCCTAVLTDQDEGPGH